MASRVRAGLLKRVAAIAAVAALAATAVACGGASRVEPERPGLPLYWESQTPEDTEDAEDTGTPANTAEPAQPASGDAVEPGRYFEDWPNVNKPGAAGTEESPPWRVGPAKPPEGPDAQRPQRALESDAPVGSPY